MGKAYSGLDKLLLLDEGGPLSLLLFPLAHIAAQHLDLLNHLVPMNSQSATLHLDEKCNNSS